MRVRAIIWCLLGATLMASALGTASAQAERKLLRGYAKETEEFLKFSEPGAQIEDACGLAVGPDRLYVSDYHHQAIDIFSLSNGMILSQIPVPVTNLPEGPCGLALDAAENLYVNVWHESALSLGPSTLAFPAAESPHKPTGIAVDGAVGGASDVYVNHRTYVAVYDPSGIEVLRVGSGSLGDAYGLAVFAGRVYVPDAADDTVKVYEPKVDPDHPAFTIDGPEGSHFVSLLDAAVAVDPTNEHLLVVDNTKPGYEHPVAAIYEFDSSGQQLGERLPSCTVASLKKGCVPNGGPIDGEPSGLAVDPATGRLFVTTGNGEGANAFEYGPYEASSSLAPAGEGPVSASGSAAVSEPPARFSRGRSGGAAASASQVIRKGPVQVSFDGKLTPHALPRHGTAPVGIAVDAGISATHGGTPPQLRRIEIAINRNGHFTPQGLPVCRLPQIQPSTTAGALASCRASLVGEGRFSANVKLPEQSPFPSAGKVLAFNGRLEGKPAILAHIYGTDPAPTSTVLSFLIRDTSGTYGTILETSLPEATGEWGFVTGLRMTLHRSFSYRGKRRSYLSAGCPAPAGFAEAVFPLARTSFDFAGGPKVVSVLSRSCKAKG
jgi:DNA-binding beta-propeller fold protein YncE